MTETSGDVTGLLKRWSEGDRGALDELMPIVHQELRRLAQSYFGTNAPTTRFRRRRSSTRHFFAVSARAMRQILIDHARQKRAAKRDGSDPVAVVFDEAKGRPAPILWTCSSTTKRHGASSVRCARRKSSTIRTSYASAD